MYMCIYIYTCINMHIHIHTHIERGYVDSTAFSFVDRIHGPDKLRRSICSSAPKHQSMETQAYGGFRIVQGLGF